MITIYTYSITTWTYFVIKKF